MFGSTTLRGRRRNFITLPVGGVGWATVAGGGTENGPLLGMGGGGAAAEDGGGVSGGGGGGFDDADALGMGGAVR